MKKQKEQIKKIEQEMLDLFKYGFDRTPLNVWKNIFENKLKGFHAQNI